MAIRRVRRAGAHWPGLTYGLGASAQQAPAMTDLQGQAVALQGFHGRVVLVNVWAT